MQLTLDLPDELSAALASSVQDLPRAVVEAVALEVIGRNDRLLAADNDAQPEVVAFGTLRFLDGAVAYLDGKRHRADRKRVGLIGAGLPCGNHETLGEVGEVGLVKKRTHLIAGLCGDGSEHKAKM